MHRLAALLLCSFLAGAAALLPSQEKFARMAGGKSLYERCLPNGWRVEDIAKAVLPGVPGSTYILAFNLDFHAIAYRGNEADLEKHWLAEANRAGTSIMAFVAQDRNSRVMCYATANVLRDDMDAMAVRFTDYWKEQTGAYPKELLFDGRVTTYEHLADWGSIEVEQERVRVRLSKRAHNPLIKEAGLTGLTGPVPWLAGRPLFIDLP